MKSAADPSQIKVVKKTDADFPLLLREIYDPPENLYVRGTISNDWPLVAIVGTRKASPAGIQIAKTIAADLARNQVTVVSGLAFGVDVAAQESALIAGGTVIAVLASGPERITPASNKKIGEKIITEGGAIISEYPPGTDTLPAFFAARNRIISGMSRGVVIIEAPERSGTLITARCAIEQNREVFVVPGPANHPNYAGSHELIRSGATLVTNAEQILEALQLETPKNTRHAQALGLLDGSSRRIVELLSTASEPLPVDAIAERLALGANVINEAISLLLIEGFLRESESGYLLNS